MSAIFEFACQQGHEFQLWSDDARMCPTCGSEYLKRIFKTPPNIGTNKPARVDALVRRELDARGITNIQGGGHEGDREKVTYKSTPEELAAEKVMRDFPAMNDKNHLQELHKQVVTKWSNIGVKGLIKSDLARTTHDNTKVAIAGAGSHDRVMTRRVFRQHPEDIKEMATKK